jgi:hypothetical protein
MTGRRFGFRLVDQEPQYGTLKLSEGSTCGVLIDKED